MIVARVVSFLIWTNTHARKATNFQWRQSQWSAPQLLSFGCSELQAVKAKHFFTNLPVQSGVLPKTCLPAVWFDSFFNYEAYNTWIDMAGILGAFFHTKLQVWLRTTGGSRIDSTHCWGQAPPHSLLAILMSGPFGQNFKEIVHIGIGYAKVEGNRTICEFQFLVFPFFHFNHVSALHRWVAQALSLTRGLLRPRGWDDRGCCSVLTWTLWTFLNDVALGF